MSIRLFFIITTLFFSNLLSAQYARNEIFYLKNGSVIKGTTIEMVPNVSYTVKTPDGSIVVCNVSDITRIVFEPVNGESKPQKDPFLKKEMKGYEGLAELGYGVASGSYGLDAGKLSIVNGYRFNSNFFAGFGTGIRIYSDNSSLVLPFYSDLRLQLATKRICPFVGAGIGGGLNTHDNFFGYLINSSLGIKINGSNNFSFHFALNYDVQQLRIIIIDQWGYPSTAIRPIQSAGFSAGMTF